MGNQLFVDGQFITYLLFTLLAVIFIVKGIQKVPDGRARVVERLGRRHKILKPGGRIEMMLPNMLLHVRQWVTGDPRAAKNIYGGQRGDFNDVWDVHKSGYDAYSMEDLVKEKNFVNYKSFNGNKSKHLHVEFYK